MHFKYASELVFLLTKQFFCFCLQDYIDIQKTYCMSACLCGTVCIQKIFGCLYSTKHSLLLTWQNQSIILYPLTYLLTNTLGECIVDSKHHFWAPFAIFHSSMMLFAFLSALFFQCLLYTDGQTVTNAFTKSIKWTVGMLKRLQMCMCLQLVSTL